MAFIFKPQRPKMRPVIGADGKPTGETVKRRRRGKLVDVPKLEPERDTAGNVVKVESRKWMIEYTDAAGSRRKAGGYTDRGMTDRKAANLERTVIREKEDVFDASAIHLKTDLTEHVKGWLADLRRAQRSRNYVRMVETRIETLRQKLNWRLPDSIRADGLSAWLAATAAAGASPRTVNHYLQTAIAFCNWCVGQRRMEKNPLEHVSKTTVTEPKLARRALTAAELDRLVKVDAKCGLIYLTAALTGLRREEVATLAWGDVHLDAVRPYITLRASNTKSRRADTIAVNGELAAILRCRRPDRWEPSDKVFGWVPKAQTLHKDLATAGIERIRDGTKVDFHALRVTHATLLATSGVSVRAAMEQMRHTDIRLTTKVYTDPMLLDTHGAVNSIPQIIGAEYREALQATGTDDSTAQKNERSYRRAPVIRNAQNGREWPQDENEPIAGSTASSRVTDDGTESYGPWSVSDDAECQPAGTADGGSRTLNPGFTKAVLYH